MSLTGFIRQQEERATVQFLIWKYQKMNLVVPPDWELKEQAAKIVDDAHRIALERGKNVMEIIKELMSGEKNR